MRVDDSDLKASLKKHGIGHPKVKEVYDKMVFKYNRTQEMAKNFEKVDATKQVLDS